ncbi:hypothetical protein [Dickeya lacustris]|uniref:Cyclic nucleotide-binding domain-containing protein n=1 Tax=Dickeya lacustris TaxID=2259638 RepID=A0ABY8G7Y0_9GAMM|nr:hypothetical protein [Dickeya lacustris]WFN56020.1 hypothetical protein O1Q98_01440 [Dickeya lacustris]
MHSTLPLDLAAHKAGQLSSLFDIILKMVEEEKVSPQLSALIGIVGDSFGEIRLALDAEVSDEPRS